MPTRTTSPIQCTACYTDGEEYALRDDDVGRLCNSCHGEGPLSGNHHPLRKVPDGIEVPADWPLQDGVLTCLTCQLPSHDEYIGVYMFLRGESREKPVAFCLNCHSSESWANRNPHKEINEGKGCGFCHNARPTPGVDTLKTVTFSSEPSVLCLRCHDIGPHPAGFKHTRTLDEERAEKLPQLVLYRETTIVCSTCHNPHLAESEDHKFRDIALEYRACPGCHKL